MSEVHSFEAAKALAEKRVDSLTQAEKPVQTEPTPLDILMKVATEESLQKMESMITDSEYVIPMMVPMGTLTMFVAQPNGAKTLSTLALIRREILAGRLKGSDVFYINEDDNLLGLVEKRRIFDGLGVTMISSVHSEVESIRKPSDVVKLITAVAESGHAAGKVFIFDTYKKFTSPMDAKSNSDFHETLRRITSMGGAVLMLHHANKNPNEEGEIVFKGTQDIEDDIDIMYLIYRMSDRENETQVAEFRNKKDRGHVDPFFRFQYRKAKDLSYFDMIESFESVDEQDWARTEAANIKDRFMSFTAGGLQAIKDILSMKGEKSLPHKALQQARSDNELDFSVNEFRKLISILVTVGLLKEDKSKEAGKKLISVNEGWHSSQYDWFKLPACWGGQKDKD